MSSAARIDADAAGIWGPRYVWVTVGAVALIVLAAIQSLAVTTVMPLVSADLDGERLYAVAFAGTLATSVIGMVAVGAWCDRGGVLAPLSTAVALFVSLPTAIIVLVYYVVYQQVENYVIAPKVMARTVSVPGGVAIVAALVGAGLLGALGALIAIPLAAGILLVVQEVVMPRQDRL